MTMKPMYPAIVNSPGTEITVDISASDTAITVASAASLPPAPNLMTIGNDETAETVRYTEVNGNVLTVERGFQSEAKSWSAGTKVARYYTAYDHDAFRENIEDHETRIETHVADDVRHVTAEKQASWDAKETPAGAQAKANQAEANAKSHADTKATQAETNAKNHANVLVGDLNQLQTANKGNVVLAVNEVFQSGVSAKQAVVDAINAKGGNASINDPWDVLVSKIYGISTGLAHSFLLMNRDFLFEGYKPYPNGINIAGFTGGYITDSENCSANINTVGKGELIVGTKSITGEAQIISSQKVDITYASNILFHIGVARSEQSQIGFTFGLTNGPGPTYTHQKTYDYPSLSSASDGRGYLYVFELDVSQLIGVHNIGFTLKNLSNVNRQWIYIHAIQVIQDM